MRHSTQTLFLSGAYGIEKAVEMISATDFDIDISFMESRFDLSDKALPSRLLAIAEARGKKFVQGHAPFGGGYENYTTNLIPKFPRVFEVCRELGIPNVVVHPLQNGRYYGNEERLFDMNMKFYSSLIPIAEEYGVRIAIENMWQRHPITGKICDDVCAPPEELARYYDTLARPDVFTVCLDLGHVALCGREPEDAVRIIGGERIGCIHAHDVDYVSDLHTLPGTARIKWDNVCRALAEVNYKGSFNLEADCFFTGLMPEQHEAALSFMNTVAKTLAQRVDSYRK